MDKKKQKNFVDWDWAQGSYRFINYTLYPDGDEIMNISSSLSNAIAALRSPTATPAPGSATTSKSGIPLLSASSASGSIMKVATMAVENQAGLLGVA